MQPLGRLKRPLPFEDEGTHSLSFLATRGVGRSSRTRSSATKATMYPAGKITAPLHLNARRAHPPRRLQPPCAATSATGEQGQTATNGRCRPHLPRPVPVERDKKCAKPAAEHNSCSAEGGSKGPEGDDSWRQANGAGACSMQRPPPRRQA
jgi:hypothetical protein